MEKVHEFKIGKKFVYIRVSKNLLNTSKKVSSPNGSIFFLIIRFKYVAFNYL